MQGHFSLLGRRWMSWLQHVPVLRPSVTEGQSKRDEGETWRLVKWLVILYQLAARHKINRVLGILNEPASLDEIARVQCEPRCAALEGILERLLAPRLQPMQDSERSLVPTQSLRFQDKRNTQRGKVPSLNCHFNPVLKPLHALLFVLSLAFSFSICVF